MSNLLTLDVFIAHKNAVLFVLHTKNHKKHKKHKNAYRQTGGEFLPLKCFLSAFKTAFFCFCLFMSVFVLFVSVKSFCKKKINK